MMARRIGSIAVCLVAFGVLAGAQTQVPFQLVLEQQGQAATTIQNGSTIAMSAAPGTSLTVEVVVTYTGSGHATISIPPTIIGSATGFSSAIVGSLPLTLTPGQSVGVTVTFTPATATQVTAQLIVPYNETTATNGLNSGAISFSLQGTGLGSSLVFSYVAGGSTITLSPTNTSVVFSPVMITQSSQIILSIQNAGTVPVTFSNIGIAQVGGPFALASPPALPLTLSPGSGTQLTITFTPTALGFVNGTLLLDTASVPLVGSGSAPPALPPYTISGPSGNATPMTQPKISLTLAAGYPVAISGTLTMSVTGSLPADPAVQFQSGGTTVSFVIPANQTAAVFGAQGTQLGLQTGTVASTITLTPSFSTQVGGVSLTPATPTVLQFSVAPASPQLLALQLTGQSATGFTVQATGFSTTRALQSLAIQFTSAAGFSMPTSQFTIDLSSVAAVWFGTTASDAFGGEFTVSVPFTFEGLAANQSVLSAISSVSATLSNALGTSSAVQTNVP